MLKPAVIHHIHLLFGCAYTFHTINLGLELRIVGIFMIVSVHTKNGLGKLSQNPCNEDCAKSSQNNYFHFIYLEVKPAAPREVRSGKASTKVHQGKGPNKREPRYPSTRNTNLVLIVVKI